MDSRIAGMTISRFALKLNLTAFPADPDYFTDVEEGRRQRGNGVDAARLTGGLCCRPMGEPYCAASLERASATFGLTESPEPARRYRPIRLCSPAAGALVNRAMNAASEDRTAFSETKGRVEVVMGCFRELG